jgi:hypothetical protein
MTAPEAPPEALPRLLLARNEAEVVIARLIDAISQRRDANV